MKNIRETIKEVLSKDKEDLLKLVKVKIRPKNSVRVGWVSEDFLDLAKTYYIDIDDNYSTVIDNTFLNRTHLSAEQVKKAAAENMNNSNDVVLMDTNSMILSMFSNCKATNLLDKPEAKDKDMLVLTNKNRRYGTSLLCQTEVCDKIHDMIGDYYILPSSVHEVILVKMSSNVKKSELAKIVREINLAVVDENDYLSDNVYANAGNGLEII